MGDLNQPINWDQLLASDPELGGLINLQDTPPDPCALTQVRSSPQLYSADGASVQASGTQNKPRFLRSADVRQETEHDGGLTKLILYDIEWKLKKNKRRAVVNTERRLRLAPSVLWDEILHQKIDTTRSEIGLGDPKATIMDTDVIVSLTGRPSAKVSKHFKGLNIDWSFAELEMERWADQLRPHQEIRIDLVINLETKQSSVNATAISNQSGGSSRTQKMLSELDAVRTEPSSKHVAAALNKIKSTRCEESECPNQGRWCHTHLKTCHHRPGASQDIYQPGKQRLSSVPHIIGAKRSSSMLGDSTSKQRKTHTTAIASRSPTSICVSSPSAPGSAASPATSVSHRDISQWPTPEIFKRLGLEGEDRMKMVRQFSAHLLALSDDDRWREANQKAEEVVIKMGLDLVQICFKVNNQALVTEGVPLGAALRWKDHSFPWLQERMRSRSSEPTV